MGRIVGLLSLVAYGGGIEGRMVCLGTRNGDALAFYFQKW